MSKNNKDKSEKMWVVVMFEVIFEVIGSIFMGIFKIFD